MNPNFWGVSVCTIDGQRFSVGDVNVPFTLQSCSKPLTYAIALHLLGADVVHKYVGQEPSGRNFNELVLDYNSNNKIIFIFSWKEQIFYLQKNHTIP